MIHIILLPCQPKANIKFSCVMKETTSKLNLSFSENARVCRIAAYPYVCLGHHCTDLPAGCTAGVLLCEGTPFQLQLNTYQSGVRYVHNAYHLPLRHRQGYTRGKYTLNVLLLI